jgi:DNA-binding GntR family transcriptional regulator
MSRRSPNPPVDKTLLSERVYARLRTDILGGRLAPGHRLVELRLAAELEVSQGTVREAIKRLSAEGLVLSVPHGGSYVTTVDADEARHAYRIRGVLDRFAAAEFCVRAQPADLDALQAQLDAMMTAALSGDGDRMVTHDATFHRLVWERCGNPVLPKLWGLIEPSMRNLTRLSNRLYFADLTAVADTHRPLLDALRAGDAELASDLFADHADAIWHKIDDSEGKGADDIA